MTNNPTTDELFLAGLIEGAQLCFVRTPYYEQNIGIPLRELHRYSDNMELFTIWGSIQDRLVCITTGVQFNGEQTPHIVSRVEITHPRRLEHIDYDYTMKASQDTIPYMEDLGEIVKYLLSHTDDADITAFGEMLTHRRLWDMLAMRTPVGEPARSNRWVPYNVDELKSMVVNGRLTAMYKPSTRTLQYRINMDTFELNYTNPRVMTLNVNNKRIATHILLEPYRVGLDVMHHLLRSDWTRRQLQGHTSEISEDTMDNFNLLMCSPHFEITAIHIR